MNREEKFIHFFINLTVEDLPQINTIFASGAHFKDPFNDVTGSDEIVKVFSHMFKTAKDPRFHVDQHAISEEILFLQWRFTFIKNNMPWSIDGSSVVTFNENDQVKEHVDYWDPAEEIYSKVGILKPFMNFLKSRLSAS